MPLWLSFGPSPFVPVISANWLPAPEAQRGAVLTSLAFRADGDGHANVLQPWIHAFIQNAWDHKGLGFGVFQIWGYLCVCVCVYNGISWG